MSRSMGSSVRQPAILVPRDSINGSIRAMSINDDDAAADALPEYACCVGSGSRPGWILALLLALVAAVNVGGTYASFTCVGGAYNADPSTNTLTSSATACLFFFLLSVAAGPACIALTLIYLTLNRRALGIITARATALLLSAGCVAAVVAACRGPLQASITFRSYPLVDSLQQTEAGFIIVMYSLTAVACGVAGMPACSSGSGPHKAAEDMQPVELSSRWRGMLLMLAVMATAAFATTVFSPVFNYSCTSYFNATSPYSMLPTTATLSFTLPVDSNPDDTWHPGVLVLKLYEDVLVYFSILFGLSLLAILASFITPLQRALHKRVHVPLHASVNLWPLGACVGELIFMGAILALYAYWFWFWSAGYERIHDETANMGDAHPSLQVYARVLGHMTTLTMSFAILPVTRNSVWQSIFGIPFERAIKYHRVLGRLTWTFVTLHMVLWDIKWLMEGTLWNNIVTVNALTIASPYTDDTVGNAVHGDNFTIVLVEAGWLVLTGALIVAQFLRRSHYDIFQYTHHLVYVFMLTALVHAWSHWYYMAGGLMLYALDKLTRVVKASRPVQVVSIAHAAGITRLAVHASAFPAGGHHAGQYAFINIPGLAALEWHPFTISSAPCEATKDGIVTFHIRDMGPGTWTHALAALAVDRPHVDTIPVSIDGPYGCAGHYGERDTVILVAGGIGVTPMHAILADLHARATAPAVYGSAGAVRKVHFIWVVREHNMLTIHADTFAAILRSNPHNMFSLHLYVTGAKSPSTPTARKSPGADDDTGASVSLLSDVGVESPGGINSSVRDGLLPDTLEPCDAGFCDSSSVSMILPIILPGRPNMTALFDHVTQSAYREHHATGGPSAHGLSDLVSVLVCGPAPMIQETSDLAFQHGMDFHAEVFHF